MGKRQMETKPRMISSGVPSLDEVIEGFRLGDNVVWQVDDLDDYSYYAEKFINLGIRDHHQCVYISFAPHNPVLKPRKSLDLIQVDPGKGFDFFSSEVHRIIEKYGKQVFYVFDNLSSLVDEWATDELVANFFKVTCPYLFELDTIAFFALTRGKHNHSTVARIRDTTQILIDVYRVDSRTYLHPLKVYDRYSPQMFLPHVVSNGKLVAVFNSGDAAAVSTSHRKKVLRSTSTIAPWDSVYKKLTQYYETGMRAPSTETMALKQELSRMIIGNHPLFNKLADHYLTLEDLLNIRDRMIGSGRIGGKAAGMLIARSILLKDGEHRDFSGILEPHDSFYIGSDVFFTFLVDNDLFRLRLQLSENSRLTREMFEDVENRFLNGKFPEEITEQFRNLIDYFGQAPIIVRSSSLLEDSFGNAFAGKYRSEFCTNQGNPDERLEEFMRAIKLVYASALNPDAFSYRRVHGLEDTDEKMAILVQRVSGVPYKHYFFPTLAGVTFSKNLFAWTPRIDPEKGMIRLVFGLGTRAVDRVGSDYPRMIAISHPELRPEIGMEITKYSQWEVDLLDLKDNEFRTLPVSGLITEGDYPNLKLFVSSIRDGYLYDKHTGRIDGLPGNLILTFNNLIKQTDFVENIGEMLRIIEKGYGYPVDMEFTAFVDSNNRTRINLLQCRTLKIPGITGPIVIPADVPQKNILFKSSKIINGGMINDIRYIVYIDPRVYAEIEELYVKKSIGRVVGRINERLRLDGAAYILMGPGRWGSNNIDLGVNITYSDIDNTAVLVEIAREGGGHTPEVSYGTHFFQDLVEGHIIYMPVYPDIPESEFNEEFFEASKNILAELLPDDKMFSSFVKLIDVQSSEYGVYAAVMADPQSQSALCYLKSSSSL
jgi:pyruvate,water dikinase